MPSPFASTPQRIQVEGMNCIHPSAPAELGPMFCPKLDSILLIAASTCQGTPYAVAARRHSGCKDATVKRSACTGRAVKLTGTEIEPGELGFDADGSCATSVAGCADVV